MQPLYLKPNKARILEISTPTRSDGRNKNMMVLTNVRYTRSQYLQHLPENINKALGSTCLSVDLHASRLQPEGRSPTHINIVGC